MMNRVGLGWVGLGRVESGQVRLIINKNKLNTVIFKFSQV